MAKEYNLHRSALEHIYGEYSEQHHSKHKVLLNCNYRTHEKILKLPAKFFYRDELITCSTIKSHPVYQPLMFLKSDGKEHYCPEFNSYLNVKEADDIISFLKEKLLPNWPEAECGQLKDNSNGIGILTTEYAQVCSYIHFKQSCSLFNMYRYIVFAHV